MVGVLMVNWLADRKGKRFCIILSIFLAAISAFGFLIGILQKNTGLIIASQFLIGYAYDAYETLTFFMAVRYLSDWS